jgi:hypothetical protein
MAALPVGFSSLAVGSAMRGRAEGSVYGLPSAKLRQVEIAGWTTLGIGMGVALAGKLAVDLWPEHCGDSDDDFSCYPAPYGPFVVTDLVHMAGLNLVLVGSIIGPYANARRRAAKGRELLIQPTVGRRSIGVVVRF